MAADRRWVRHITDGESHALLSALAETQGNAHRADPKFVMLPAMVDCTTEILEELENGRGFVLLRGLPIDGLDDRELYTLYRILGAYLGTVITQNKRGERIVEITDRGAEYGPGVPKAASPAP
jgi:hypothetical protein